MIDGLAALGPILPGLRWAGLSCLSWPPVGLSATVRLVAQMAAIGTEGAANTTGDPAVKTVVLGLTLSVLWLRLHRGQVETGHKALPVFPSPQP